MLLAGVVAAHAESPMDSLQRFLADPANVFGHDPNMPGRRHVAQPEAPPVAPLVDVPLPHLRPGDEAAAQLPLNYAAADDALIAPPVPPAPAPPVVAADDAVLPEPSVPALPPPIITNAPVPVPHLRPADLLPAITAPPLPDGPKIAALTPVPFPDLVKPPPAADTACMAEITAAGVIATPVPPISEDDGQCGIATPVSVTALEGGAIKLSPAATIDCSLAQHLANWVHDVVAPQAETAYGKPLTGLRVADAYTCRSRDNIPGAKLSEHAHGTAIDISDFKVGDDWVDVEKDWSGGTPTDATFLADVRKAACGPFTTVLGPGSDSYHTSHFHLDIIKRRTAGPSHGLYCH
jgi:hypothetical protein